MVGKKACENSHVRIGVAWRGQLIHDEILDRRREVAIGTRADCTVQLASARCPDAPERLDFLLLHDSRYWLALPEDPRAAISLRGAPEPQPPQLSHGQRAVLVDGLPGGSLQLGDLTLLFQFVAADAAPLVTREQVVLRLGLVHDERLICDRVFDVGKRLTVGHQKRLDLVLPDDDYQGPPVTFLRSRRGDFVVAAPDGQALRVALGSGPMDMAQLLAQGKARLVRGVVTCPLPVGARGRLTLGAHTLLFQVVRQSVTVPMPRARGRQERLAAPLLREPAWTASLLAAVLLVGALVGQALLYERRNGQFVDKVVPAELADNHTIEIEIPHVEEPPTVPAKPDPGQPEQPAPLQPPTRADPRKAHADPHPERTQAHAPGDEAPRNARALAGTIAASLQDHNGAAVKLFQDDPTADTRAATTFGGAQEDQTGGPGQGGLQLENGPREGRTAERIVAKRTSLGPREPDVIRTQPTAPREPICKLYPPEGPDDGSGEKELIARKIAGRARQVKACYEAVLRENPNEGGKIRVNFTVGTAGTVTQVQVVGAVGMLAECIEAKFLAIRGLPILAEPKPFNQTFLLAND